MSERRARSPVAADHRSALPSIAGIPWWGAVVLAMTAAAIGFAYDAGSGSKSLSGAFSICYVAGCLAAVLAVRQSGVFTAVIQPPLVLFLTVPAAYFVLTGGQIKGIKDALINCGYPLIERFPLMFFTSGAVLLIGVVRWYLHNAARRSLADAGEVAAEAPLDSRLAAAAMSATPSARRSRKPAAERPERPARPAKAKAKSKSEADVDIEVEQPPRRKSTRSAPATSRSRHNRPADTEIVEPVARGSRRQRTAAPVEAPIEPRRRIRSTPEEPRRNTPPADRRSPYERPERQERAERPLRGDRPERGERPERAERSSERRRRTADYDPYEGRAPGAPSTRNGTNGTHHPVSRVRYRGADDEESKTEHRSRPRNWEYDG